jgi:DNA polymerase III alpha subunit
LSAPLAEDFAHLHVRSGFSYGYGVATPEELAGAAAGMGMRSMALTDRDGLHGIPRFWRLRRGRRLPHRGGGGEHLGGGHLVLLAEGIEGYRSLCRLITAYRCSSEDRRRPSCPLETVLEHASGLVCLTGAIPFGLIPGLVLSERGTRAAEVAGLLREAFGRDGVFVEITDDGTAGGRKRLARLAAFARERALPTLATNEAAYLRPEDHRLHEVLVAASHLSRLPGPEYRPTDQLYLKPPGQMRRLFAGYPEALANAAAVAERCAGTVDLSGRVHVPVARVPRGRRRGGF